VKKKILFTIILLLVFGISCTSKETQPINSETTEIPENKYGYMITPVTEVEAAAFIGSWQGTISGFDFRIHLNADSGIVSATIDFGEGIENLFILGANETTLYMFRKLDNACISMYLENTDMKMEYYEKGAPRIISLSRID
jgi:hypothetical protein